MRTVFSHNEVLYINAAQFGRDLHRSTAGARAVGLTYAYDSPYGYRW